MEQQTNEWLSWRRKGIGSSDAAAILGVSPWATAYDVWMEKTGREYRDRSNWATQRGNEMEPKARADYEFRFGIEMKPELVESKQYPFLKASMDGANFTEKGGLEIKCPGEKDHALAAEGKIPDKYMAQIQHQLLVTGFDWIDYYSFRDEKGIRIRVYPDLEFCKKLLAAEIEFWNFVQSDTPPPLVANDFNCIRSVEFKKLAAQYKMLASTLEPLMKTKFELESAMSALIKWPRARGYGIELMRITSKGPVDYSKISELNGVNLEPFRSAPTVETKFRVMPETEGEPE